MNTLILIDDQESYRKAFQDEFSQSFRVLDFEASEFLFNLNQGSAPPCDAILIDLLMPDIDGISLMKKIKKDARLSKVSVPVFILSNQNLSSQRILALQMGAVDYINKEMDPKEIKFRVQRAISQRSLEAPSEFLHEGLSIDRKAMSCQLWGERVDLTKTEFQILATVLENKGVIEKTRLMSLVWANRKIVTHTLNSHLFNLNEKLKGWSYCVAVDRLETIYLRSTEAQPPSEEI